MKEITARTFDNLFPTIIYLCCPETYALCGFPVVLNRSTLINSSTN
jgi:hypothetical protein